MTVVRLAAGFFLTGLTAVASLPACAGERLPLERLVADSSRILVYDVSWGSGKARYAPGAVLFDARAGLDLPRSPGGLCVPDAKLLQQWLKTYPHFRDSVPLWRKALRDRRYSAVVFLRESDGELRPYCDAEALLVENWATHPLHAAWRQSLDMLITDRRTAIARK